MINLHQLINGLFTGSVLIALGLYPRLLQTLAEALIAFSNQFPNGLPIASVSTTLFKQLKWFAAIGTALPSPLSLHISRALKSSTKPGAQPSRRFCFCR